MLDLFFLVMTTSPTTRVIVKNLARNCTTEDLKKAISSMASSVTDAKVVVSKSGNSRRFGFIGFKSEADAEKGLTLLNKTYIGTSKVVADFALPVGDSQIPDSVGRLSKIKKEEREKKDPSILSKEAEESVLDHGRVHVVNLPHAASREEIEIFFSAFGTVREVHVVMDEDLGRPRGIAFVTFVFPKDAIKAIKEGDMSIFQGRLVRVSAAKEKIARPELKERMTDFQAKRLEKKKAEASTAIHTWNLLFTSANAAASAIAEQLDDVDRSDLLLGQSAKDDVAVKAAIAETEVISQTKEWLKQQGISAKAFERSGKSILTSNLDSSIQRSTDCIIIKHLPVDVELDSLRFMFTRNGETLTRFILSPSKTVAIAQFADSGSAKRSFNANAFRKYKAVPLYLEWAPVDVFVTTESSESAEPEISETEDLFTIDKEGEAIVGETSAATALRVQKELEGIQTSRLCVRNVAFEATSKDIRKLFTAYGRVVAVRLPTKMAAAGDATTGIRKQHRGFAFVEFTSRAEMAKAYEALQNTHLYGRKLVLEPAAMEDGSVEAARLKAQRREDLASGTVATESKRRKIEATAEENNDEAFDEMFM
jgi:multiple RNA-binding domain-containing protein 1